MNPTNPGVRRDMDHWFRSLLRHRRTVRALRRSCPEFLDAVRSGATRDLVGYLELYDRVDETADMGALLSLMLWRVQADKAERLRQSQSAALTRTAGELARVRGRVRRTTAEPRDGLPCLDCGNVQETVSSEFVRGGANLRVSGFMNNRDYCRAMIAFWNLNKKGP